MFFRKAPTDLVVPTAAEAMPGRNTPIAVPETHYVNGNPMKGPWPDGMETLIVAMGCFWGAERFFWQTEGVYSTSVGYAGGSTPHPTYQETCTGQTGHTEAVMVVFDPAQVQLETLFKIFWENHDPTTLNQQGNDVGTQYRSAVYANSDEQLAAAHASRDVYQQSLNDAGFGEISTEIGLAGEYYYAEEYHQQYLAKNPGGYCNHGFCQVGYAK